MPWTRSEAGAAAVREAWGLALLGVAVLFLTKQALGLGNSGWQLTGLLLILPATALGLRLAASWPGFIYFKTLWAMILLGQLGMLAGLALDFGPPGLLLLAGWCSTLGGGALDDLGRKLLLAPWGHAGMLLGCNLGMLLTGCSRALAQRRGMSAWLFLAWSNLGMLAGLLATELWPLPAVDSLQQLALLVVMQMLLAMGAGMGAVWWLSQRLHDALRLGTGPVYEGGN
jgi:hypothetical protein